MIAVYLVCLTAGVLLLQYGLANFQRTQLRYEYEYDKLLAEPGEEITMTSTVKNYGRLPLFYVRLAEYFIREVRVDPEKKQRGKYNRSGEYRTDTSFMLLPYRQYRSNLTFSLPGRGIYELGHYYLQNGDYLGVSAYVHSGELDRRIVIMPDRCENGELLRVLGGYLGDISVRRFLLEDPILTVGCRDYTGREPLKSIAWVQSARTGKTLVKQYDHTVEANATVLLNLQGGTEEQREECLRMTRTVCEELERKRITYDFYTNGDIRTAQKDLTWLAKGLGRQHYLTIMYGLGISKCRHHFSLEQLVDRATRNRRTGNGYILITPPLTAAQEPELRRLRAFSDFDICLLTAGMGGGAQ